MRTNGVKRTEVSVRERFGGKRAHIKLEMEEEVKRESTSVRTLSEDLINKTYRLLLGQYGKPKEHARCNSPHSLTFSEHEDTVIKSVISVILSQNTRQLSSLDHFLSDKNSSRAMESLFRAFPSVDKIREASTKDIEDAIRSGGLAGIKSKRIQEFLQVKINCSDLSECS